MSENFSWFVDTWNKQFWDTEFAGVYFVFYSMIFMQLSFMSGYLWYLTLDFFEMITNPYVSLWAAAIRAGLVSLLLVATHKLTSINQYVQFISIHFTRTSVFLSFKHLDWTGSLFGGLRLKFSNVTGFTHQFIPFPFLTFLLFWFGFSFFDLMYLLLWIFC